MDIKTVCIIGGAGFVGRSIADQACAAGHRVRVVTRSRPRARELMVLPTLEISVADVNTDEGLARVLDGMDAVINLSGVLYPRGGSSFRQVHAELPRRIAFAAMKAGVRRMLHMSSLGADVNGPSEYLRSKGEGEVAVRSGPSELARTVFRPSVIFGEHDDFLNMFATMARISPVIPLARAQTRFQPIWVEDVARCFVTSIEDPRTFGQAYDLCGPRVYTLEELMRFVIATLGLKRKIVALPESLAQMQALTLEYLPGKLMTRDNLRSMSIASVCSGPFPSVFGFAPSAMEAVVPQYLAQKASRSRYDQYRHNAGR